jgi:hypothetical protein
MINSAAPSKHRDGVLLGDVRTSSEIVAARHGGQISNQSRATSNRVSGATTRILKISDSRLACEIDRLQHETQKIGP